MTAARCSADGAAEALGGAGERVVDLPPETDPLSLGAAETLFGLGHMKCDRGMTLGAEQGVDETYPGAGSGGLRAAAGAGADWLGVFGR